MDPPRRGCHIQVLETIGETEVPRVIYVSCDPASLARDLRRLVDCGYKVEEVQPGGYVSADQPCGVLCINPSNQIIEDDKPPLENYTVFSTVV